MQSENRFIDDLTRMMSGAMSAAGGVREEAEARMRQHFEGLFARMDLVRREEFNVVRDMAALARQENERLAARVAELEGALAGGKAAPKKAAAKKAAPKKAAPKKAAAKAAAPARNAAAGTDQTPDTDS